MAKISGGIYLGQAATLGSQVACHLVEWAESLMCTRTWNGNNIIHHLRSFLSYPGWRQSAKSEGLDAVFLILILKLGVIISDLYWLSYSDLLYKVFCEEEKWISAHFMENKIPKK